MTDDAAVTTIQQRARIRSTATIGAVILSALLGGCAGQGGDVLSELIASPKRPGPQAAVADGGSSMPQGELEKATEYWGKRFAEKPSDLDNALNYARNLKAMGQKQQAMAALQQAAAYHGQSKELAGEYGRLALELDQVKTAKPLLAFADDATKPDWRVVSARGTVLAKEGSYKDAIPYFERAMALSNSHPSVMNNLAMAHAMAGEPERSEQILRTAAVRGGNAKVRQNLALVLGLQGKYDEATVVAAKDTSATVAQSDTALVRQMVRLEPKAMPVPAAPVQVAGGTAAPALKPQLPATAQPQLAAAPVTPAAPAAPAVTLKPTTLPTPVAAGNWQAQVATSAPAPATPTQQLRPSR